MAEQFRSVLHIVLLGISPPSDCEWGFKIMAFANIGKPTKEQEECKHIFSIFIEVVDDDYDDRKYQCEKCGWYRIFEGADS